MRDTVKDILSKCKGKRSISHKFMESLFVGVLAAGICALMGAFVPGCTTSYILSLSAGVGIGNVIGRFLVLIISPD